MPRKVTHHAWLHDLPVRYISPWPRRLLWAAVIGVGILLLVVL